MAWIACDLTLPINPKTLDLADLMGWSPQETVGRLLQLWGWCLTFADDGDLTKFPIGRIAQGIGLPPVEGERLLQALVKSRWVDKKPYLRIHDWWALVGMFLRGRYRKKPQSWRRIERLYNDGIRVAKTGPDLLTTRSAPGREQVRATVHNSTQHKSTQHNSTEHPPPPHPARENEDDEDDEEGFERLCQAIREKTSLRSLSRSDERELRRLIWAHGRRVHDASEHLHSGITNVAGYLKVVLEGKNGPDPSVERFRRLVQTQGF
jgi:hypothetical protein